MQSSQSLIAALTLAAFLIVGFVVGPLLLRGEPPRDPELVAMVEVLYYAERSYAVGTIPLELRDRVPVPPEGRLLGTITEEDNGLTVYIETGLPPIAATTFYTQQFTEQGLDLIRQDHPYPRLYDSQEDMHVHRFFCAEDAYRVSVKIEGDGITTLRYDGGEPPALCGPTPTYGTSPLGELALTLPPNAERTPPYASQIPAQDAYYTTDTFTLPDADPAAILAHFDDQMRAYGWQPTGPMTWTSPNEPAWQATLTVMQSPLDDDTVTILIEGRPQ